MNKKRNLRAVRKKVDIIDRKIMNLLQKRKSLATEFVLCKLNKKKSLRDPRREKEILREREKYAQRLGLEPKRVRAIWVMLMNDLLNEQKIILKRRKVTSRESDPTQ